LSRLITKCHGRHDSRRALSTNVALKTQTIISPQTKPLTGTVTATAFSGQRLGPYQPQRSNLASGTVPLAQLSGITTTQLSAPRNHQRSTSTSSLTVTAEPASPARQPSRWRINTLAFQASRDGVYARQTLPWTRQGPRDRRFERRVR